MLFVKIHKLSIHYPQTERFRENVFSIKIKYDGQERVTTTKLNDPCPVWEEAFVFDIKDYIKGITLQIIETGKTNSSKIYKEYTYKVNYDRIKRYHNIGCDICFSMGGLYVLKNKILSELKYDLNNALGLILERDTKIVLLSKNLKKHTGLLEKYQKKISDIKKITIS